MCKTYVRSHQNGKMVLINFVEIWSTSKLIYLFFNHNIIFNVPLLGNEHVLSLAVRGHLELLKYFSKIKKYM